MKVCGVDLNSNDANVCLLALDDELFQLPDFRARRISLTDSGRIYYERSRAILDEVTEAEECARAIVFLCMPAASYITGQCLAVDGGFSVFGF